MSQINPRRDWSEGIHTLNQKELLIDQRLVVQPRRPVLCTLQLSPLSYVTMDQWSNRRREDVHNDLQWLFWLHYTTKLCHDVNLNTDRNRSQCAAMDSFHCSNPSSIGCPISKSHRLFHPLIHPLHFHPFVRCPPGLLNTQSHPKDTEVRFMQFLVTSEAGKQDYIRKFRQEISVSHILQSKLIAAI